MDNNSKGKFNCNDSSNCNVTIGIDNVSFSPATYAASNCNLYGVTTPLICGGKTAIVFIKNPNNSETAFFLSVTSVSNYADNLVTAYLASNLDSKDFKNCDLDIFCTNLGCNEDSNAKASFAVCKKFDDSCAEYMTRNIVSSQSTFRVDRNGTFIITPGQTLAVIVESDCTPLEVGIDIRWWESDCLLR